MPASHAEKLKTRTKTKKKTEFTREEQVTQNLSVLLLGDVTDAHFVNRRNVRAGFNLPSNGDAYMLYLPKTLPQDILATGELKLREGFDYKERDTIEKDRRFFFINAAVLDQKLGLDFTPVKAK